MAFALWTKTVETSLNSCFYLVAFGSKWRSGGNDLNFHKTTKILWKNMTSLQNITLLLAGFVTLS